MPLVILVSTKPYFPPLSNHAIHIPPTLSVSPTLHISSSFSREMGKNLKQENSRTSIVDLEIWFFFGFLTKFHFFQLLYSFPFRISYISSLLNLEILGFSGLWSPFLTHTLSCTDLIHSYCFTWLFWGAGLYLQLVEISQSEVKPMTQ